MGVRRTRQQAPGRAEEGEGHSTVGEEGERRTEAAVGAAAGDRELLEALIATPSSAQT